jgi:5-methylcytosine-specific restriction endonuclease McrA
MNSLKEIINLPVLVLNQSFEPLTICRARRAVVLVHCGKAEMVEDGLGFVRTSREKFAIPSVIRLGYLIRRPFRERKLTRYEIFSRDHYACQYCGKETKQLTLDHVMPRFRGGKHTWENVVSACVPCNRKKAGRTPSEAGMKLVHIPARPASRLPFTIPYYYRNSRMEWQKYLPQ